MASLTFANVETRCANQLRLPTSNSTEMTKLDALINEVYRDIYAKSDWWWLVKHTVINTVDDLNSVTVSVTSGSTTVTFSTGGPAGLSVASTVMLVPTDSTDWQASWRVASHTTAASTCTLDAAYTGATSTSATANFYRDRYNLPTDFGKGLIIRRGGYEADFQWISPADMARFKSYDLTVGKPQVAAVYDFTTSGDPTSAKIMIVHPYPDNTYRMDIDYKQTLNTELSGSTRPLIPDDYVQILVYGTLARAYPIFLNDTERGLYFQNLFNDLLALMVSIQRERSHESPQFQVDDQYRRWYRGRARFNAGRGNLGSFFDRLPNIP